MVSMNLSKKQTQELLDILKFYGFDTADFDDEVHNGPQGRLLMDSKNSILAIDNGQKARTLIKSLGLAEISLNKNTQNYEFKEKK